jgi:hypothetical protein
MRQWCGSGAAVMQQLHSHWPTATSPTHPSYAVYLQHHYGQPHTTWWNHWANPSHKFNTSMPPPRCVFVGDMPQWLHYSTFNHDSVHKFHHGNNWRNLWFRVSNLFVIPVWRTVRCITVKCLLSSSYLLAIPLASNIRPVLAIVALTRNGDFTLFLEIFLFPTVTPAVELVFLR